MLSRVVICFFDNNYPMSSFCEVLRANSASTPTANNYNISLKNFGLGSRGKLDKGVVETFAGLAMYRRPGKSKNRA